jgi:SAM-dependent methyltransferase
MLKALKKWLKNKLRRMLAIPELEDSIQKLDDSIQQLRSDDPNSIMTLIRNEYTVMPRFGYHQPLDYNYVSLPPQFQSAEKCPETDVLLPTGIERFGYSPDDTKEYLRWGKYDHDQIVSVIEKYSSIQNGMSILDFGCSSGRVLRHFEYEHLSNDWKLYGCDVQARAIEWMRFHLPNHFNVITTSVLPHLPYEDGTFDCIYGFSVFTHIKYNWDAWLMELRRVLKPGGLLIQTIHSERAWEYYAQNRDKSWIRENLTARVLDVPIMDVDYLFYGDIGISQVFWKNEVAIKYWGRYFVVLERRDPPQNSFQDWIICKKPS